MLKKYTKKEKKIKEENKKKSVVPRYITFLILSIILGGIFTALTSYAATIAASNISYDNTTSGISATTAQGAIDEAYQKVRTIKQGDYIKLTPSLSSYSIPIANTGYSAAQTIQPNELTLWRVLTVKKSGIEVISHYVSSYVIRFGSNESRVTSISTTNGSMKAYTYYAYTLTEIASKFVNNSYTSGYRYPGFNTSTTSGSISINAKITSQSAPWACSTSRMCDAQESLGGGDLGYFEDVSMIKGVYGDLNATEENGTTNQNYYLASRKYKYISTSDFDYEIRYVSSTNSTSTSSVSMIHGYGTYHDCYTRGFKIRPILILKPSITISGGKGTIDEPYTLG